MKGKGLKKFASPSTNFKCFSDNISALKELEEEENFFRPTVEVILYLQQNEFFMKLSVPLFAIVAGLMFVFMIPYINAGKGHGGLANDAPAEG